MSIFLYNLLIISQVDSGEGLEVELKTDTEEIYPHEVRNRVIVCG